jgi:hypothetical protein
LLGLEFVVVGPNNPNLVTLQDTAHWHLVLKDAAGDVYQNQRPVPRAFVVPNARVVPLAETLTALKGPQFDPYQEVLLAPDGIISEPPSLPAATMPARATSYQANNTDSVEVKVEAGSPGWLVVTDMNYPGWTARIDGQLTSIRRADYLFRSVYVDGNPHAVTFTFDPLSVRFGLALTGLTWLVAVGIVVASIARISSLLPLGNR